ncbi:MAG: hypothetical protein DRG11_06310 [Epsilonproteobacteria bacterium]|nr:MAG: hypothetical protein DRG11_06310 [Campylobacterota bacterium]
MRLLILVFCSFVFLYSEVLLKEDFNTLANWEPLTFKKIKKHSTYKIKDSTLVAKSDDSASGIKFKKQYNIYDYPVLSFKWKINNIYKKGDATKKTGDDYPIRIYVMFKYDPKKASFFESIKYSTAKTLYGAYPPHSTINYIWSNKTHKNRIVASPYTDRAKMIAVNSGKKNINIWQTHRLNVLEDYKKAFGKNPPDTVSIAIMTDSDNTHETSVSFVDFIEISN